MGDKIKKLQSLIDYTMLNTVMLYKTGLVDKTDGKFCLFRKQENPHFIRLKNNYYELKKVRIWREEG